MKFGMDSLFSAHNGFMSFVLKASLLSVVSLPSVFAFSSSAPEVSILGGNSFSARQMAEKCFAKNWKSGEAEKFLVNVEGRFCLNNNFESNMPTENMGSELIADAHAKARVLQTDLSLVYASAKAVAPLAGAPSLSGEAFALGYKVWEENLESPNIDVSFAMPVLTLEPRFTYTTYVGPLPVVVEAGVTATVQLQGNARLAIANGALSLQPQIASEAFAEAKMDTPFVDAGGYGSITLLNEDLNLNGEAAVGYNPSAGDKKLFYTAKASAVEMREVLRGGIELFVEPKGLKRFQFPLVNFLGEQSNKEWFNFVLEPTPFPKG